LVIHRSALVYWFGFRLTISFSAHTDGRAARKTHGFCSAMPPLVRCELDPANYTI
jgi:hypothetical protein